MKQSAVGVEGKNVHKDEKKIKMFLIHMLDVLICYSARETGDWVLKQMYSEAIKLPLPKKKARKYKGSTH